MLPNHRSNRRQTPRAPISIAVKERYGGDVALCQSSDISTEGMFLARATEDNRSSGQKCWLEFTLPGSSRTIVARGEIIRQFNYSDYHLTAVRFATLAPSHRRMIESYVDGPPVAARAPVFLPPLAY